MGLTVTSGMTVLLDTAPLIYFLEKHPDHFGAVALLIESVYAHDARLLVSLVSYIELTTHPTRAGDRALAGKYREFLMHSDRISVRGVDLAVADAAIGLRARYALRTPDAIVLATAIVCGADCVVTNDAAWKRVDGIKVVLVGELP